MPGPGRTHQIIVVVGWAAACEGRRVLLWLAEARPRGHERRVLVAVLIGVVRVLSHGEAAQRILQLAIHRGVVSL